jgi:hypothetical protein
MDTAKNIVNKHPRLIAWALLAVGMIAILIFEAQEVGLQGSQWFWLVVITALVAGLCIWIITWGDGDEDAELSDAD